MKYNIYAVNKYIYSVEILNKFTNARELSVAYTVSVKTGLGNLVKY